MKYHVRSTSTTPGLYIPDTTVLDQNARPAPISPAINSPAARRSAVPSRAVRCRALRCCVVLCFLSNIEQCRVEYVLLRTFLFASCSYIRSLTAPLFSPPRTRTADQNVTPPTRTQHRKGNLLCTSSPWHYQIIVRTKSWASSFCPFYMF